MSALSDMQPMQPYSWAEEQSQAERWEALHDKLKAGGDYDFALQEHFTEAAGEISDALWEDIHKAAHRGDHETVGRILVEQAYCYWLRTVGL